LRFSFFAIPRIGFDVIGELIQKGVDIKAFSFGLI